MTNVVIKKSSTESIKEYYLKFINQLNDEERRILGICLFFQLYDYSWGKISRQMLIDTSEMSDPYTEAFTKNYDVQTLTKIINLYSDYSYGRSGYHPWGEDDKLLLLTDSIKEGYYSAIRLSTGNSMWKYADDRAIDFLWREDNITTLYNIWDYIRQACLSPTPVMISKEAFCDSTASYALSYLVMYRDYDKLFPENISNYLLKVLNVYSEYDFNFSAVTRNTKIYRLYLLKHIMISKEKYLELIDKLSPLYKYLKINNPELKEKAIQTVQNMVYHGECIAEYIRNAKTISSPAILNKIDLRTLMMCDSYDLDKFAWNKIREKNADWIKSLINEYIQLDNLDFDNVNSNLVTHLYDGMNITNETREKFFHAAIYREMRKQLKDIDENSELNYNNVRAISRRSINIYNFSYVYNSTELTEKYYKPIIKEFFGDISDLELGLLFCADNLYRIQFFEIHKVDDKYKIFITSNKFDDIKDKAYIDSAEIIKRFINLNIKIPFNDKNNPIVEGFIKMFNIDCSTSGQVLLYLYNIMEGSENND